ncbi:sirohydrochlorin cobaltochelatase [Adlercreutzia sp. ZJ304]|uniref:sirohydrochlorin cobaltochelatase n=1 Tax=Adlercreutzia sp. ZJ304 TaxID=2709791 RepID=UPI0013EBA15E|nr:sirohydrochlorin cobaltochelatase [Adlercreutzia sp. ZJ304]
MPRLEFSERFANDLAMVTSPKVESRILEDLDNIEMFAEFGSANIPMSIREEFGDGVRKVANNPFDLVYTFYPELDLIRIEALIPQRAAW